MTPPVIGAVSLIGLLITLLLGIPVMFSLIVTGFLGYWAIVGIDHALYMIGLLPHSSLSMYSLTVVPMFVLMGNLLFETDFAKDIYSMTRRLIGRRPGGLAQATVFAGAIFGAITGSSLASAATLSKMSVPEMRRYGYSDKLAMVAPIVSGPLASMIPPSLFFVLYATVASVPVGRMLIAGILPGILNTILFIIVIHVLCVKNPKLAPLSLTNEEEKKGTFAMLFSQSFKEMWAIILIVIVTIGSIYLGLATPTEAGALGAAAAFILSLITKRMTWERLKNCLRETALMMATIYGIVVGAFIFSGMLTVSQLPQKMAQFISDGNFSPMVIMFLIVVLYLILGTFLDTIPMLFITVPLILPIVINFGWNLIWFGIVITQVFQIAMFSPPYGITLYTALANFPDAKLSDVLKGLIPFVIADLVMAAILIAFPIISLLLPSFMD